MKKFLTLALSLTVLAACGVDTTGLSADSSRTPKGSPTATVVVTEYGDLQCPACKAAHELLTKPLIEKYGNRIRFEFKHFPLQTIHPYALTAAMAAECAADQGKFWEFLDYNYTNQGDMNSTVFHQWATDLSLDTDLFDRCLASSIKKKTVLADYKEGEAKGVSSTPSYFVNTTRVPNTLDGISGVIDTFLAQSASAPL